MEEAIDITIEKAGSLPYKCHKCADVAAEFWMAPCGHIFCEKCKAEKCLTCKPANRLAALFYWPRKSVKLFLEASDKTEDGELANAQCPICMDELTSPLALKCGHVSCGKCLRKWRSRQSTGRCHTCRAIDRTIPVQVLAGKIADSTSEDSDVNVTINAEEEANLPQVQDNEEFRAIYGVLIIFFVVAFWIGLYSAYSYFSRH